MDDLDLGATIKGFAPGQKVANRYVLQKLLGRGGMGIVWLVRDEELERDVALKFLPEVVALDPEALRDLKRETRRSLELTHPHIIRIYDFVQDGRTAAISMEYVAGSTLAQRKLDQPEQCFQPDDLRTWVGQLAQALDHAHRKAQVVHRDLKPANLMVDAREDLKIADFGIAASVSDSVSRVSAQAGSSGTPMFMSPQQMMGEKPAVTDDVYAMGATLYELLTGKPPFYSGNVIAQVQGRVPPSLADRRLELGVTRGRPIPPVWEQTIAACLAKDPAARPASAGAVAARLGIAGGAVEVAPEQVPAARPKPPEPPPVAAAKPPPAPATAVPAFRRWFLGPLLAAMPAAVALMALTFGQNGSDPGSAVVMSVGVGLATGVVFYLFFLVLLAVRRPWRVRSPVGISVLGGLLGACAGLVVLEIPMDGIVGYFGVPIGALVGALSGWLLHEVAVGRSPGSPPLQPSELMARRVGVALGLLAVVLYLGVVVPSAEESRTARLHLERQEQERIAAENARIAAEQERLRQEAAAEAERRRLALVRQQAETARRAEAAKMVPEAFRLVFDRAPDAPTLAAFTTQLVANPDWDAARLRQEMRQSAAGRLGGRVRVPEEFASIGAAVAAAVEGNVVHVGPGTYRERVLLTKNVSLLGAGRDRVIVEVDAARNTLQVSKVSGVTISGFTFRHSDTNENESRASVVALGDCSVTFTQNIVERSNGNGLHVKGTGKSVVTGNIFRRNRWAGAAIYEGTSSEISRNEFVDNEQIGLALWDPTASTLIDGNTLRGNKQNGLWVSDGANVTLINNVATNNGTTGQNYGGIGLGKGSPRLRGNTGRDNIGQGIWWRSEATPRIEAGNLNNGQPLAVTP